METNTPKLKKRRVRKPKTLPEKIKSFYKKRFDDNTSKTILLICLLVVIFGFVIFYNLKNPSHYMELPKDASTK